MKKDHATLKNPISKGLSNGKTHDNHILIRFQNGTLSE